jgi:hypothetical protein
MNVDGSDRYLGMRANRTNKSRIIRSRTTPSGSTQLFDFSSCRSVRRYDVQSSPALFVGIILGRGSGRRGPSPIRRVSERGFPRANGLPAICQTAARMGSAKASS